MTESRRNRKKFRSRGKRGPANIARPAAANASTCLPESASCAEENSLRKFCPHEPWPRQSLFLGLHCLEAFYGGAAGGGKSEALLMAALEFAHVPGYAALILRKDTQRLRLAGGLIPRSHEWLTGKGAQWNDTQRTWTFPTSGAPATIRFGYLRDVNDKYRYASSEFQFIAFDELTEFLEEDYLFLFSRLRKSNHLNIPLRMRSASNPGGLGHAWVKGRFIPPNFMPLQADEIVWQGERAYVPAKIGDNPALDAAEYGRSLAHLPPLLRERLMHGDWSLREDALLKAEWLRYFRTRGTELDLFAADGRLLASIDPRRCRRMVTIDPAGTSADRAREKRGHAPCSTAIQVWDQVIEHPFPALVLREAWRGLVGFDELCHHLREINRRWHPERLWIENEKLGQAAVDILRKELPMATVPTLGRDKVTRATWLVTRLERGEVFLPQEPLPWRLDFEAELLGWTGHPRETSDQVDAAAYAAIIAERCSLGTVRLAANRAVLR